MQEISNCILFPCDNPDVPYMRNEAERLNTFRRWPPMRTLASPRNIAEAGFYYLGQVDMCKCFYCGGGLKDWGYSDDPWVEHGKWFPNCEFVLNRKGPDWVSSISRQVNHLQFHNLCSNSVNVNTNCVNEQSSYYPTFYQDEDETLQAMLRESLCQQTSATVSSNITVTPRPISSSSSVSISTSVSLENLNQQSARISHCASTLSVNSTTSMEDRPNSLTHSLQSIESPEIPSSNNETTNTIVFRGSNGSPFTLGGSNGRISVQGSTVNVIGSRNISVRTEGNRTIIHQENFQTVQNLSTSSRDETEIKETLISMGYPHGDIESAFSRFRSKNVERELTLNALLDEIQLMEGTATTSCSSAASNENQTHDENSNQSVNIQNGPCVVCLQNVKEMVLVPCGHFCTCRECVRHLTRCPVCRTNIERSVRMFGA